MRQSMGFGLPLFCIFFLHSFVRSSISCNKLPIHSLLGKLSLDFILCHDITLFGI